MKNGPRLNPKVQAGMKIRTHLRSGLYLPENLKYSDSGFWFNPATGKMGLTDFTQQQTADFSFIEFLVSPGTQVEIGTPIARVESVKANVEMYAPLTGKVVAINSDQLNFFPQSINSDPYGEGWMFQLQGVDSSKLMDAGAYKRLIDSYQL